MPFADYESFDACERANSDKDDPGAYCATIHHEATGEWPGQSEAADFYDDPAVYAKHAMEAMEELGVEPTMEKMQAVEDTATSLV